MSCPEPGSGARSAGGGPLYTPHNILLTGGAGFIGSHVAARIIARYPQYKVPARGRPAGTCLVGR